MTKFSAGDIDRLTYPAWLSHSDDGFIAYSQFRPDVEGNTFNPELIVADAENGEETLTIEGADMPSFAPGDHRLAYISSVSGERQIWIREYDGDTWRLTNLRHGVTSFDWSADGASIIFEAPLWPEDMSSPFSTMSAEEKRAWKRDREKSPIVIEELMYKFDETGIDDGSIQCVGIANVSSAQCRLLTDGKMRCHGASLSPDGKYAAFYGQPYGHHKGNQDEVFVLNINGDDIKQLTKDCKVASIAPPVFTPDSSRVAYAAHCGGDSIGGFLTKLFTVSIGANGGSIPESKPLLPANDDIGVDNRATGRSSYGTYNHVFQPSRCRKYLYYISAWQGANRVFRVNFDGEPEVLEMPIGEGSVHSFCPRLNGSMLLTRADFGKTAQLYLIKEDGETQLTRLNEWANNTSVAPWREVWFDTKDGKSRVQGWVLMPPDAEAGRKYPAVLNIHGGPTISYVRDFNLEFQALAASGSVVLICNPRGSSGYGAYFADGKFAWGQDPIDDILDFVDAAVKLGSIDEKRVGITGGSYGGYMTLKLIGLCDRFKAAVAQRSLCNVTTSYGTGDMGFLSYEDKMPSVLDFLLGRVPRSNITRVDDMKTPLLLLHGTNDYRCSFEQAEQMFITMKQRQPDVPVRLVAFPNENHNVSRTGRPESQRVHMSEMVDWFVKYLGDTGEVTKNA